MKNERGIACTAVGKEVAFGRLMIIVASAPHTRLDTTKYSERECGSYGPTFVECAAILIQPLCLLSLPAGLWFSH